MCINSRSRFDTRSRDGLICAITDLDDCSLNLVISALYSTVTAIEMP